LKVLELCIIVVEFGVKSTDKGLNNVNPSINTALHL
jgi:hypothetical protein